MSSTIRAGPGVVVLVWGAWMALAAATATPDAPSTPAVDGEHPHAPTPSKPHIILFVVDDVGWANVGWHNENVTHTPNANKLLKESVELSRNYVFYYCSPSRSSLLTGRLPLHVSENNGNTCTIEGAAPTNMTLLPKRLKAAGYSTHQLGKWHLGSHRNASIPHNRGFDTSFGYLGGEEDHYTNTNTECGNCGPHVDLWYNTGPAYGHNNTGYTAYEYDRRARQLITDHGAAMNRGDTDSPLFLYLALQVAHAPNEPDVFGALFDAPEYTEAYANYNGMCSAWDSTLGNVTAALKAAGMWENTLLVFTSDNGGPAAQFVSGHNANNYPLRGGKHTAWEGGHRAVAFVSGGVIPPAQRGTNRDGYVHIADWYGTILTMVGLDPSDPAPGMPAVDSLNVWPYISGAAASSPRTEVPLASRYSGGGGPNPDQNSAALIVGDYKLVRNWQQYCFWQGPLYPNATTNHANDRHCPDVCPSSGCLFNIVEDPGEHQDLAAAMPELAAKLLARAEELDATSIEATHAPGWRGKGDPNKWCAQMRKNGGFWGPYLP